jgi:hypothetical protein
MKLFRTLRHSALGIGLIAALSESASAQHYSSDWSTLDGGGGTSTGGGYTLNGTIGQPDAGASSGGLFTLHSGFWVFDPVTGLPRLFIAGAGGQALISWTPPTPGFVLQTNVNLSAAGWADAVSGSTNPVVVPATGAAQFYRLRK